MPTMNNDETDVRYGHILQVLTDWVDTTVMVAVMGRGTAKSTVVQARRSARCVLDMPGAAFAFVANSYNNLADNIMPAVQKGWQLMGIVEGVHYVKGERPPEAWRRKCSVIVDDYRHVYSFWNGSVIFMGSLDNPSLLAGKSVVHLFYDEAKFAKDIKVNRAMPILRGDAISFGRSHLFLGMTITTDMPDVGEGEYDWFFRYANEMDTHRIELICQTAAARNDVAIACEKVKAKPHPSPRSLAHLERELKYWDEALRKLRKGQTFFINASSFANIEILTIDYIRRLMNGTLEPHEFNKSVLGMKPGVRRDMRFYVLFGEKHKFVGTLSKEEAFTCEELTYLDRDRPLDGGMDFGNMLSFVVGQQRGGEYRVLKDFYELPPRWFRELADQFLAFFSAHRQKTLNLYYDRAGNNYQRQNEDYASKIKEAIEKDAGGRRTGWLVNLMSRGQSNLRQEAEYDFMQVLMGDDRRGLPRLYIDSKNCRELVSSMELARAEIKYRGSAKVVHKIKKSEKLEVKKLPMLSTNMSDAFKYLVMRREWMVAARTGNTQGVAISTSAVDDFMLVR